MRFHTPRTLAAAGLLLAVGAYWSAALGAGQAQTPTSLSRQQADLFARKLTQISQLTVPPSGTGAHRTPVSEGEVNSWFAYLATPMLPRGVSQPQVTIVGDGHLTGHVTVDLDAIAKPRATGGLLDPWSYLSGHVPVSISGILRTQNGTGRFELQSSDISGVTVPKALLQQLVSAYSRTPNHPQGVRLDEPFDLPASIRQIEVEQGRAVVVQ